MQITAGGGAPLKNSTFPSVGASHWNPRATTSLTVPVCSCTLRLWAVFLLCCCWMGFLWSSFPGGTELLVFPLGAVSAWSRQGKCFSLREFQSLHGCRMFSGWCLGSCDANAQLEIMQSLSPRKWLSRRAPVIYILSAGYLSHGNLSALRCFVNILLAAALLIAWLRSWKEPLYTFFPSWSSNRKWDHCNIAVLEINRILQKRVRWWEITSVTERDKKHCTIQSTNQQVRATGDRLWACKQSHLGGGFHTSLFYQRGRVWKFFSP